MILTYSDKGTIANLLSTIDENMDINPLVTSIDNLMGDIPLSQQVYHMSQELDRLNKLVKTLKIELQEKEEMLKMGLGGGGSGGGVGSGGSGGGGGGSGSGGGGGTDMRKTVSFFLEHI